MPLRADNTRAFVDTIHDFAAQPDEGILTADVEQLYPNLDQSFVIENIVYDDYILEIYYGRTINNLNAGEPVIDKVCTVGNNC